MLSRWFEFDKKNQKNKKRLTSIYEKYKDKNCQSVSKKTQREWKEIIDVFDLSC